jgi:L-ascorbate metabolism protein UlaG (beta-lactamase superfamily)
MPVGLASPCRRDGRIEEVRLTYIGHSTVLIELDGVRVLTDPVLRGRVAHLVRRGPAVDVGAIANLDLVLVSHMHLDHFDPGSLRMIDRAAHLIVPQGALRMATRLGFGRVTELAVGESSSVAGVDITATWANHRRGRLLSRHSEAVGFTLAGAQRVYFAGDTDLFPAMREIAGSLDVALLPVGGWGPRLGPGHLDPERAAESLTLLEPRVAVPIHWGTLYRIGLRRSLRGLMAEPPRAFARAAARCAPTVDVRILEPGAATTIERASAGLESECGDKR